MEGKKCPICNDIDFIAISNYGKLDGYYCLKCGYEEKTKEDTI